MFERFTDRARRVIVLAQEEARQISSSGIGSEHLVVGLVREGEGVAGRVLSEIGVTPDRVRDELLAYQGAHAGRVRLVDDQKALAEIGIDLAGVVRSVEERFGAGALKMGPVHLPFTEHAKEVLAQSLGVATGFAMSYVSTEHVLLGMCRLGETGGRTVLEALGVDVDALRDRVLATLEDDGADGLAEYARTIESFAAERAGLEQLAEGLPGERKVEGRAILERLESDVKDAQSRLLEDARPVGLAAFRRVYAREVVPLVLECEAALRAAGVELPAPEDVHPTLGLAPGTATYVLGQRTIVGRDDYDTMLRRVAEIDSRVTELGDAAPENVQRLSARVASAVSDTRERLARDAAAATPDSALLRRRYAIELSEIHEAARVALERLGGAVA